MIHEDIRAALAAATPGPWAYESGDNGPDEWADMPDVLIAGRGLGDGLDASDAHLIANAPTWLADLLAEVDDLRASLVERDEVVDEYRTHAAAIAARAEAAERCLAEYWAESGNSWRKGAARQFLRALDGGEQNG